MHISSIYPVPSMYFYGMIERVYRTTFIREYKCLAFYWDIVGIRAAQYNFWPSFDLHFVYRWWICNVCEFYLCAVHAWQCHCRCRRVSVCVWVCVSVYVWESASFRIRESWRKANNKVNRTNITCLFLYFSFGQLHSYLYALCSTHFLRNKTCTMYRHVKHIFDSRQIFNGISG